MHDHGLDDSRPAAPSTWPLDAWYVAATPGEIADKPFARQICGIHVVFFRTEGRGISALEDFCPHRGAPLSLGSVRGETLVCGYHGLAVDCRGRVDNMPSQRVKNFPSVRAFPVIERYGFVWIWPGNPAGASPEAMHPLPWAESDEWAYGGGLYHIKCDYRLMIDNLMDLTHETYVHSGSIGQKEIDETPVKTRVEGQEVVTSRMMDKVAAPPFWRMALRGAGLPEDAIVDRWQICCFSLPSHVMIEVGVALEGEGGYHADNAKKASSIVVDFITPETETTHWYFWGMARQFAVADAALTATIREGQGKIFAEDLNMLEQQQRNLLLYPDRRLLKLNIDAGGARSRLMIDRAIAQDRRTQ
ncbi:aromatic ring-hydroxylating dioxygenase subunit alpha [Sphingomonas sp. BIUV-7]|uniref:Aromatic ring-hydroxylating dioxygenase subunit alpha n=1 Tax=Sphingomonas natans TaxID=3063330 RepID=A0ABT8YC97_9SPHN|nr:aromatic ring-hydroxylating dioxygenase subunit alpha [Sphingomonas sp. BIUV-7]MDO6415334.1 aromatic ring-hydroxylating dioxygenase subunit alpha [Sphingomonas sp. BIUV-7]